MIIVFALELRIMIPRLPSVTLIVNFYSCRSVIHIKIYLAPYCFKLGYRVIDIN